MSFRGWRDRLERRLEAERPEPSDEFVSDLAERLVAEPIRRSAGWRVAYAAGFTALLVVAFALTGSIGYAASAVQGGTTAVTSLVAGPSKTAKLDKKADQRQAKGLSASPAQSSSLSTQSSSVSTQTSPLSTQSSSDEESESDDEEEDDEEEDDDGPADDQYEDDVLICHHRQDGSGRTRTIRVDADEVARHLAHGDTLGPCPDDDDDDEEDDD